MPDIYFVGKENAMDIYVSPVFPVSPGTKEPAAPPRLKGKVVGVRSGRSGEVGTTRILTIKLDGPYQEIANLLHAEVEILVKRRTS